MQPEDAERRAGNVRKGKGYTMTEFRPEGFYPAAPYSMAAVERAMSSGKILEGRVKLCDAEHNLIVDLGIPRLKAVIPREQAALGVVDGSVRDIAILSRVNKTCCFSVKKIVHGKDGDVAYLSRTDVQKRALEYMLLNLRRGDVVDAKVTHIEPFGVFADIGAGIVGLLSIENISVSRIAHPSDRFCVGQNIKVIIKDIDVASGRFTLSHKELLGTWEENAALFTPGQTVCGFVRSVEDYGVFVELMPNLAGLAEMRQALAPRIAPGMRATVFVKNLIPEKMKVKLNLIDVFPSDGEPCAMKYFECGEHITTFTYSPSCCPRVTRTVFE